MKFNRNMRDQAPSQGNHVRIVHMRPIQHRPCLQHAMGTQADSVGRRCMDSRNSTVLLGALLKERDP
jgi:hypothetical protein